MSDVLHMHKVTVVINITINFVVTLWLYFHAGNEAELNEMREELVKKQEAELNSLRQKYDDEVKALQERFSEELRSERTKMEDEKQKDMDRLKEAMDGNVSEQQQLQLRMLQEQHERELEAVREELVRTHMEKFTEMTARLEKDHEVGCTHE